MIKKQDYLSIDLDLIKRWKKKKVLVIGNPPFGRQSSMAKKFIKLNIFLINLYLLKIKI